MVGLVVVGGRESVSNLRPLLALVVVIQQSGLLTLTEMRGVLGFAAIKPQNVYAVLSAFLSDFFKCAPKTAYYQSKIRLDSGTKLALLRASFFDLCCLL